MEENNSYSIRPAGRHILTIGRDLIQNKSAAIVELVKNAYDADSKVVNIVFKANEKRDQYKIVIEDKGHGMSRDTVINKWLVPSTDDKLERRISPKGRIMQGRKGVGRYAASILGEDLLLETVSNNIKTTVYVEWRNFSNAKYLDEVEVLVESEKTKLFDGTILTILGNKDQLESWDTNQINDLKAELKKLISPVNNEFKEFSENDTFNIHLHLDKFLTEQESIIDEDIEPYPLFNLFDYRITGKIEKNGKGSLVYSIQKVKNATDEIIPIDLQYPTNCGDLHFDIRVYDREKESIESLIFRGLKDENDEYVGNLKARQILNEYNGIGVYRNGFRIRPLGDPDFDWLKLNKNRVDNQKLKIGGNQVIGYVQIESEEESNLIEKSARDGLKDNESYEKLKNITSTVLNELEQRRYTYRNKAGLSRNKNKIERDIAKLFEYEEMKSGIRNKLEKDGVDTETTKNVLEIIEKNEEQKNKIAEDLRNAVAIYQGQATLGKIINIVLHEGRRPLNYFKNQIPNLEYWHNLLLEQKDISIFDNIFPITEGITNQSNVFVKLFSRLDPLAAGKRSKRKPINLYKSICNTFDVFEKELEKYNIEFDVKGNLDFKYSCWEQDIYSIFTNLIDNSIYWMVEKHTDEKHIYIKIESENEKLLYIDYKDSGPGINSDLIESEVIFEPQFSTKPKGTGLGLAIAGEAAMRNYLELKAIDYGKGAYFRIEPKLEEENEQN